MRAVNIPGLPAATDAEAEGPGDEPGLSRLTISAAAPRMNPLAMLVGSSLRVLFGAAHILLALGVVALAVIFDGGTMRPGSAFVVFSSLVVFVSGQEILVGCQLPAGTNSPHPKRSSNRIASDGGVAVIRGVSNFIQTPIGRRSNIDKTLDISKPR
jgi:hypothetical protein